MDDCIFCKISAGHIPTHKIYEDDTVFAFLDIHPVNPGHALVIPKKHVPDVQELDEATYMHLMLVVKKLAQKASAIFQPVKTGISVIGFDVPHAHVHVMPLHGADDLTTKRRLHPATADPTPAELDKIAAAYVAPTP